MSYQLVVAFMACLASARAWSPPHRPLPSSSNALFLCIRSRHLAARTRIPPSGIFLTADEEGQKELIQDDTNEESPAVYGVSYIGGDPCGSKYNDDPFDKASQESFKPGLPDDMKARIAALAAKKVQDREKEE